MRRLQPGAFQVRFASRHITGACRTLATVKKTLPPHSLLPTKVLLRSLLVATVSSHRTLLDTALYLLKSLSKPGGSFYSNVNKNWLLYAIVKTTLYNHFCAGENISEVKTTIQQIKSMGYRGVILTYAREVTTDSSSQRESTQGTGTSEDADCQIGHTKGPALDHDVQAWHQGVMQTVSMIGKGDFLALKLTGAGAAVTEALSSDMPLPTQMDDALEQICEEATHRHVGILIDAEQQYVQAGIDELALRLMRRYNRGNAVIIFNTYQAYLKSAPSILSKHLSNASREGFTLGLKLVRGAYISTESRHLIHDDKEKTDECYNYISQTIIQGKFHRFLDKKFPFPRVQLFLATHNRESTFDAYEMQRARLQAGLPIINIQYGQLLGMADEVSCKLLQLGRSPTEEDKIVTPEVYKCLSWGTLADCISYLQRRAVENRDAVSRTQTEYRALKREVWRRLKSAFSPTSTT